MGKLDDMIKDFEDEQVKAEKIEQMKKIVEQNKPKPVINEDTTFTPKDRAMHVEGVLQRFKDKNLSLRRKEKKMMRDMEYDNTKSTQGIIIGLAVVGLVFVMLSRDFLGEEAYFAVVVLVGAVMFLPIGMIMGWIVFDPVMRCKIFRKVSKTNYGIVNFVGKGKRMVSKIKNFDYGLIWQGDLCWVLTRDKVYQITKDGNAANDGFVIDPDSVVTLVDTVPVVFVDMDSMEPLSIVQKDRVPVYPSEIGPACKSWMDIQKQKALSHRKQTDYLMLAAVVGGIGALVISLLLLGKVEEMAESLETIKQSLAQTPP